MLVIPLLVSALIVGVAEMGEMRALKTVGLRTLVYTVAVSSIAVANSLAVVNALQPGAGVDPALAQSLRADGAPPAGSSTGDAHEAEAGTDTGVPRGPPHFFSAQATKDHAE